jgi:uncharacterized protein (DUF305 family)
MHARPSLSAERALMFHPLEFLTEADMAQKIEVRNVSTRSNMARTARVCSAIIFLVTATLAGAQGTTMPAKAQSANKSSASMSMKESMSGMMKGMQEMPISGDTDRDFAAMMKMHHQGAIDMAQVELASGKDPQLRKMAKEIISAQKKEIREFDAWMKKHSGAASGEMHK